MWGILLGVTLGANASQEPKLDIQQLEWREDKVVPNGGTTSKRQIAFKAKVSFNVHFYFEVEVKPVGTPYDGKGVSRGSGRDGSATATAYLNNGSYKWRARVLDEHLKPYKWVECPNTPAFRVKAPFTSPILQFLPKQQVSEGSIKKSAGIVRKRLAALGIEGVEVGVWEDSGKVVGLEIAAATQEADDNMHRVDEKIAGVVRFGGQLSWRMERKLTLVEAEKYGYDKRTPPDAGWAFPWNGYSEVSVDDPTLVDRKEVISSKDVTFEVKKKAYGLDWKASKGVIKKLKPLKGKSEMLMLLVDGEIVLQTYVNTVLYAAEQQSKLTTMDEQIGCSVSTLQKYPMETGFILRKSMARREKAAKFVLETADYGDNNADKIKAYRKLLHFLGDTETVKSAKAVIEKKLMEKAGTAELPSGPGISPAPTPDSREAPKGGKSIAWIFHLTTGGKLRVVSYERDGDKYRLNLMQGKVTVSRSQVSRIEKAK